MQLVCLSRNEHEPKLYIYLGSAISFRDSHEISSRSVGHPYHSWQYHILSLSRSLLCSNLWKYESLKFVRNWKKRESTSISGYHRDSKSIARLHSFRASVIVGKNSTFRDDYLVKARGGTHARKNRIAKKRHNFSFIFHISLCNLSVIDTAIEQHEERRTMFDVRVIGHWQIKGIIASARSVIYRWNLTFLY